MWNAFNVGIPVLIHGFIKHFLYLTIGTGYAWAWHNKAKLKPWAFLTSIKVYSKENVGALAPIGSGNCFL